MTTTQLAYVLAVDRYKNFARAADHCCVTQPTLSMQILKLEVELGVLIFDRSKKPVQLTPIGHKIIEQAKIALYEFEKISEVIQLDKITITGVLKIGVIPTIAPYLVPLFVVNFLEKYPNLEVHIAEMHTQQILSELSLQSIDCGIMATPIANKLVVEEPLYYEPLVAYMSEKHPLFNQKTITTENLENYPLLMLTEENCLHAQIKNLCNKTNHSQNRFQYLSGSLETIKQMVVLTGGLTLLPELAIYKFDIHQMDLLRYFRGQEPVREISIVTQNGYRKHAIIDALAVEIKKSVPSKMLNKTHSLLLEV